jgi:membrane-bound serine protease (ClpP class)
MDVIAGFGVAWVYSIGFLLLGFTLLLLEIFVIPGLNIFGLLGLLAVSTGVYIAYLKMGLVEAVLIAAVGIFITLVLLRSVIKSRGWRSLVLSNSVSRAEGFDSARKDFASLLGLVGEAVTPLRPTGRVRFEEELVDVVSEGGFVLQGDRVRVIAINGHRVVVQPLAATEK